MGLRLTDALRNTILDSGMDAIFNSGVLEIRSGTIPATPNLPKTGTLLASITLPADAFAAAATGSKAKNGTWEDASADGTGTATWFRLRTSGDTDASTQNEARLDGTITATGGGGDMEINNTSIATTQTVTVTAFSITMPAS
jgi:hypothetical protein